MKNLSYFKEHVFLMDGFLLWETAPNRFMKFLAVVLNQPPFNLSGAMTAGLGAVSDHSSGILCSDRLGNGWEAKSAIGLTDVTILNQ